MKSLQYAKIAVLGLSLLLFCLHGASARQLQPLTSSEVAELYKRASQRLERLNYHNSLNSTARQSMYYSAILAQAQILLERQTEMEENSMTESGELTFLLNLQMQDLLSLESQWRALEEHSKTLSQDKKELTNYLSEARQIIAQLRWNLECALERITDAEDGAVKLLDENNEIYSRAVIAIAKIEIIERQLATARRGGVIGFAIGGVSFGVGTPLIIEGIRSDNQAMIWSGVGTIGVSALVWSLGHYVFQWW